MGENKAEQMMQTALANGWKSEVVPDMKGFEESGNPDDIIWRVYCLRGSEKLQIDFEGAEAERQVWAQYKYGDLKLRPARRAGVIRLLTGKADPRKFKGSSEESVENLLETRSVPWSPDAPFLEILLAVLGKQISWVRRIDGEVCSSHVPAASNKTSKYFRVLESPPHSGRRILEWTNGEGFHAVGLDQIIDVA